MADANEHVSPKAWTGSVRAGAPLRARVSTRLRTQELTGPYYAGGVKLTAGESALALPGPVDSSHYFDADEGISSVCVVNDLGFMIGVSTWGAAALNSSFVNDADHVRWVPPHLPG
jgi:hypothetical protein